MKVTYDGNPVVEKITEIEVEEDFNLRLEDYGIEIENLQGHNDYLLLLEDGEQVDKLIKALQLSKSLGWLHELKVVDNDYPETPSEE